jgi:hypothetical protein
MTTIFQSQNVIKYYDDYTLILFYSCSKILKELSINDIIPEISQSDMAILEMTLINRGYGNHEFLSDFDYFKMMYQLNKNKFIEIEKTILDYINMVSNKETIDKYINQHELMNHLECDGKNLYDVFIKIASRMVNNTNQYEITTKDENEIFDLQNTIKFNVYYKFMMKFMENEIPKYIFTSYNLNRSMYNVYNLDVINDNELLILKYAYYICESFVDKYEFNNEIQEYDEEIKKMKKILGGYYHEVLILMELRLENNFDLIQIIKYDNSSNNIFNKSFKYHLETHYYENINKLSSMNSDCKYIISYLYNLILYDMYMLNFITTVNNTCGVDYNNIEPKIFSKKFLTGNLLSIMSLEEDDIKNRFIFKFTTNNNVINDMYKKFVLFPSTTQKILDKHKEFINQGVNPDYIVLGRG